ncbi:MAG: YgiT-type zinc finger protein [Dehalococcoidia bacterium]
MSKTKTHQCPVCGRGTLREQHVTWFDKAGDPPAMVTNVPATVCDWCGTTTFAAAVVHELQRLAQERPAPSRVIQVPVYEFAAVGAEATR